MRSVTGISWFVLILLMLQACSGIQVSQDYEQGYDFSGFKTFTWKPNNDNEYGIRDNRLMDERIRTAIESTLTAKQYTRIESGEPDFYISYHMTVEQVISSNNVSGGFSIGRSSYGRYGGIGVSTGSQVRAYDQGTLLDFHVAAQCGYPVTQHSVGGVGVNLEGFLTIRLQCLCRWQHCKANEK